MLIFFVTMAAAQNVWIILGFVCPYREHKKKQLGRLFQKTPSKDIVFKVAFFRGPIEVKREVVLWCGCDDD